MPQVTFAEFFIFANGKNLANTLNRMLCYTVPAGSSISMLCPGQPAMGISASDPGVTVLDNPS